MVGETEMNALQPETKSLIPKVAIACQGGGSHAAFTAGVLLGLLAPGMRERFNLVALSGTSGGAVCASLVWAGMLSRGPDEACARLERFWDKLEARNFVDAAVNFWTVWFARFPVTTEVSPYAYQPLAAKTLEGLLKKHLDLKSLDPSMRARLPALFVGATDIQSGERVVFGGEKLREEHILASAAVPPIFRAVHVDDRLCWDGLFSTNPPVREFTELPLENRPDEIWVIQINPQIQEGEAQNIRDIVDRRNELSGNLSLGQELYFIHKLNKLLEEHAPICSKHKMIKFPLLEKYRHIKLRIIELGLTGLDYPSKLDRNPDLIKDLMINGRTLAQDFFTAKSEWPRKGSVPAKSVLVV